MTTASEVLRLINVERRRRSLRQVRWDSNISQLEQAQAKHCARVNRATHSDMHAGLEGENLAQVGLSGSAKTIVDCWMRSRTGHRECLLNPKAGSAGVGISRNKHWIFATYAFEGDGL